VVQNGVDKSSIKGVLDMKNIAKNSVNAFVVTFFLILLLNVNFPSAVSQESPKAAEESGTPKAAEESGTPKAAEESGSTETGGGCLIATAAFGSELAPQVQFLREIRDNTVTSTQSGTSFMTAFNSFYYLFSPAVSDLERQNPVFKETVKLAITPLLSSLSLLQYVDIDSEAEMLGYGISIILLNVGMYFVAPAFLVYEMKRRFFD